MRLAHIALLEPRGDRGRQLLGGEAARRHRADQRQVDVAAGIDGVAVGDAVLAEHHDAQLVAGIERVRPARLPPAVTTAAGAEA